MSIKNLKPKKSKKGAPKQGYFKPSYPEKYLGDSDNIIYRSGWERKFCIYCDRNDKIVEWSSEPFAITYLNKIDAKKHKYYPDFYLKVDRGGGNFDRIIAEIKPKKYTQKPSIPKRKTKKKMRNYYYQAEQFVKNASKWEASKIACKQSGYKFEVITEDFIKKI